MNELYAYEIEVSDKKKKEFGVVYTPLKLAASTIYLGLDTFFKNKTGKESRELSAIEKVNILKNMKIIDPCTGTGVFIHAMLAVASLIYKEAGIAFNIDKFFKNCIYAVDVDKDAINVAKKILNKDWGIDINILNSNILVGDSIFNNHGYTEIIPEYNRYPGGYWDIVMSESEVGDDEFLFGGEDTLLKLFDTYKSDKTNNENREKFIGLALDYAGIDTSNWRSKDFPFVYQLEFLDVFVEKGGFDLIIGNPPYVAAKNIQGNLDELIKYKSFNTSADLSIYFYESGYKLLNENGVLCTIASNSWINAKYAEKFRQWLFLKGNSKLRYLIDFENSNLFDRANVMTAIAVLDKQHRNWYKMLHTDATAISHSLYYYVDAQDTVKTDRDSLEGLRVGSEVEVSIRQKYDMLKLQRKIGDFCNFRSGLTTGGKELFKVDEEMYNKYPGLVKKAQDCKNLMAGTYFYMLYIPSGVYKNMKTLPEDVISILESKREKLESRDATTIGDEWYSVKHGINRINSSINRSAVNVANDLHIYDMEPGAIPVDAAMICAEVPDWVQNYLNLPIMTAIYNIGSRAGNCRNTTLPRKSAREINDIPVPFSLVGKEDVTEDDIIEAFGFTDYETIYLINTLEVQ